MKKDNIHEDEKRRECLIFNLEGGRERERERELWENKRDEERGRLSLVCFDSGLFI